MTETQKTLKLPNILSFFLNFKLAKGGASAPLAPPLVAPLAVVLTYFNYKSQHATAYDDKISKTENSMIRSRYLISWADQIYMVRGPWHYRF